MCGSTGDECGLHVETETEKTAGNSDFQETGYWSSGVCFPFFSVAVYLNSELLDGNEKERKTCLDSDSKPFVEGAHGTKVHQCAVELHNSLSQDAVGANSLHADWATSWSPDLLEAVKSKGNSPRSV